MGIFMWVELLREAVQGKIIWQLNMQQTETNYGMPLIVGSMEMILVTILLLMIMDLFMLQVSVQVRFIPKLKPLDSIRTEHCNGASNMPFVQIFVMKEHIVLHWVQIMGMALLLLQELSHMTSALIVTFAQ